MRKKWNLQWVFHWPQALRVSFNHCDIDSFIRFDKHITKKAALANILFLKNSRVKFELIKETEEFILLGKRLIAPRLFWTGKRERVFGDVGDELKARDLASILSWPIDRFLLDSKSLPLLLSKISRYPDRLNCSIFPIHHFSSFLKM